MPQQGPMPMPGGLTISFLPNPTVGGPLQAHVILADPAGAMAADLGTFDAADGGSINVSPIYAQVTLSTIAGQGAPAPAPAPVTPHAGKPAPAPAGPMKR